MGMKRGTTSKDTDDTLSIAEIPKNKEVENMNFEDDIITDFSLAELLETDTPEVKNIKTIHEKEDEYVLHLLAFEYSLASHYLENNRKLTDKEVVEILRHIKQNIDTNLSILDDRLETAILQNVKEALIEEPISRHELLLVIDYILWCIDNRSWMEDRQGYVKGLCYMLNLYTDLEEKQYEQHVKKLGKKLGLDEDSIDGLLMKNGMPIEQSEEEIKTISLESEFFAMDDKAKTDFLLEHGYEHFDLLVTYIAELEERKEFGMIKELTSKYSRKYDDKTEIYMIAGTAFLEEDKNRAKSYYCKALHELEKDKNVTEETKAIMSKELKNLIKGCDRMK